jgi:FkbM family methyltransferase
MKDIYIDADGWARPTMDRKLKLVDVSVSDLHVALPYVKRKEVAVQAGGACGLWPRELAKHFSTVYTYEPEPLNYACLLKNTEGFANVLPQNVALGRRGGKTSLHLDSGEADNCGAYYTEGDVGMTQVLCLDTEPFDRLDFLCLDVEGRELDVLFGAASTLKHFKPVIMLENKQLAHMQRWHVHTEDVTRHLRALGWRLVDSVKRDVIFVHEDHL